MATEITIVGAVSFLYVSIMLVVFSVLDVRDRRIPNRLMGFVIIEGIILIIFNGHLMEHLSLHIIALIIALSVGSVLFKLKAIGGADAKAILFIACISPGIEFRAHDNLLFEGIIGCLVPVLIMLILGYLYYKKKPEEDTRTTPLIPFLLIGFLLVQVIALL